MLDFIKGAIIFKILSLIIYVFNLQTCAIIKIDVINKFFFLS